MPRRLSLAGWIVVTLLFVGFAVGSVAINAAVTGCHIFSVDGTVYEAANREVLRNVPIYPGSTLINTGSIGDPYGNKCFPMENSGPYSSFHTYVNYNVPSTTSAADVFAFYDRYFAESGWARSASWNVPEPGAEVTYTRGKVYVSVRPVIHGYSLGADHDTTD